MSAFFYTLIAGIAFPGNTSGLLMMLSLATTLLVLVSIPFLIVVDHKTGTGYAVLPTSDRPRRDSNVIVKTTLDVNRYNATAVQEAGKHPLSFPGFHMPCHLPTACSRRPRPPI